jgi:DNA primase small subunit
VGPLSDVFSDLILVDQECFASEEGWEELLHLIPDRSVVDALRKKWQREPERSSYDKWDDVKKHAKSYESKSAERVRMLKNLPADVRR